MFGFHLKNGRMAIPGAFTIANLLCGYLAMVNVLEEVYISAAWWIIIAGIFDALDGKVARLTGSASNFGIEFDSLADVVSFGAAPAILFYRYALIDAGRFGAMIAFVFLAAGALRLARFNTMATTGKKTHFTGMPIPSGAGILASWILFSEKINAGFIDFDLSIILVLLVSFAMISSFKYETFPRIAFGTPSEIIKSGMFIAMITMLIIYPDELFFPVGITYLVSGPVRFVSAPAVSHVWHKVNSR